MKQKLNRIFWNAPWRTLVAVFFIAEQLVWVSLPFAGTHDLRILGKVTHECYDANGILITGSSAPDKNPSTGCPSPTPIACSGTECEQKEVLNWTDQAIEDTISSINGLKGNTKTETDHTATSDHASLGNSGEAAGATAGETTGGPARVQVNSGNPNGSGFLPSNRGFRGLSGGGSISASEMGMTLSDTQAQGQINGNLSNNVPIEVASAAYATAGGIDPTTGKPIGPGSIGKSKEKSGEVAFGNSALISDNSNALSSQDPEDYFNRLGADMNIFKTVHDRYLIKTPSLSDLISALPK